MDFLTGIWNFAKSAMGWFTGGSALASLVQTALTAWGVSELNKTTTKENTETTASTTNQVDPGVRLQVNPDTEHKIPVVYGQAVLGGIITDAQLSNGNKTMHYVFTICEKTGTKMSDNQASVFTFRDVYWDDQRVVFQADGITADYSVDRDGNVDYSIQDIVKIYCYAGNSTSQVGVEDYATPAATPAYLIVPGWTTNHTMTDLIFAVARVDYNKDKGVTGVPTMTFKVENSMTLPGDCIYDYMTNTTYGAGIAAEEIYSQ